MLIALFAVVVVAVIVVRHLAFERGRETAAFEGVTVREAVTLRGVLGALPLNARLQPGLTWSVTDEGGDLLVGVHPVLSALLGGPREACVAAQRGVVEEGEPLIQVRRRRRCVTLPAPVSGVVKARRRETNLGSEAGSWLCRLEPADPEEAAEAGFGGERARAWTGLWLDGLRERLMRTNVDRKLGLALADGGDLPVGILGDLEEEEWEAIVKDLPG